MINPGAAPDPAAQRLVEQPAVRQHVYGRIGRIHVHRPEGSIPISPDPLQRAAAGVRAAKTLDQVMNLARVSADPEAEGRFALLSLRQIEGDLHRAARIEPCAGSAGKARALQRRRLRQTAVPAQKFLSIPG